MNDLKKEMCRECYDYFIPNRSKLFCDRCVGLLERDRSIEDSILGRKFLI